ncbi:MAG: L-erythro-3,5-diaminohexanoate dehydrogenase [Defluviitaleaceae bacterium]|nr:L-erythro-3,5-diaminohexanoate dehydrogenase [Defluviitaleaceae bacterium]MCL2238580.1 L-erythro-3,5-diaminohexanoate dehydrogenase [Defluviitaleaceae bacterium]
MKKICKYGTHRVLEPAGALPQAAYKLDNAMDTAPNEIRIDVQSLNIDSASFTQIREEAQGDIEKIKAKILDIVDKRGKMQNPVTGSGGMLIGTVAEIGTALHRTDIKKGDKIATLVSLSLTPLKISEITAIHPDIDRVDVTAQAILFETGIYAKLPEDMPEALALAVLDVAGAPAQTAKLVRPGDSVLILGGGGKSGMLCCNEAMKRVGPTGNVVAVCVLEEDRQRLLSNGLCHHALIADATRPLAVLDKTLEANGGREYDISFNVVNVSNTEMAGILPVRDGGIVYLFSMATSFTQAALGAEGAGKDVTMLVGNGYTKDHAEIALAQLRDNPKLRKLFTERWA